jgi:hypothetical protein
MVCAIRVNIAAGCAVGGREPQLSVTVLYGIYKSVTSLRDSRVESTANKVMVQSPVFSLPLIQPTAVVMGLKRLFTRAMNWRGLVFFCSYTVPPRYWQCSE